MANYLDATIAGVTGIISIVFSDSFVASTSTVTIVAKNTSKGVGDSISVNMGYSSNKPKVFQGYVKSIDLHEAERTYTIVAANELIRAIDYFLASTNPENPFTRSNITVESLVGDLMSEAGISSYSGQSTGLTLGINTEVQVNLTSSYDYSKFLASLVAFQLYADDSGTVHLADIKPYSSGGSSVATLSNSNIISIDYSISDRDLRNRVVVYGDEGVFAEAKATSPYLPSGFYKSVVIAAAGLGMSTSQAQSAANFNLTLLNRLTKRVTVSIIGDPDIQCRDEVTVNKSDIGVTGKWRVYSIEQNWSKTGFLTNMELRN